MNKNSFDLERIKGFINKHPESDIIIIANNKRTAIEYWENIKGHLKLNKRPYIISNSNTNDGMPYFNSLVLKIDKWWENKNAIRIMREAVVAKQTLPITHIPPFVGGATDE